MTSDAYLLRLRQISKTFAAGIHALASVDLDVEGGEVLTLLGPSGCGKSTILRLIAGLTKPDTGEIVWASSVRPEIGFVFQDATLMPWASVRANVFLPLRLAGIHWRDAESQVAAMLASVGLSDFATAYPRELSGGMRMRVSLARALVARPPLLLLDEPFAALDEITRFGLNEDLLRLQRETRTTIIFVTHSVFESVYLSSRVAIMTPRPGRVAETFAITAPEARGEDFRLSACFAEQARVVSSALKAATLSSGTAL